MAGSEETSGETKTTPDKTETKDTTNGDSREDSLYAKHYRYMTSEVGTPYYVAPEVLKQQQQQEQQEQHDEHEQHPTLSSQGNSDRIDRGYTTKCDIWSIGVLAYFTLTGTLPVMGDDERETVQKLMDPKLQVDFSDETVWEQDDFVVDDNGTTHPTSEGTTKKPPRISKAARTFCKALLQRDPNKRPTAREALQFEWIVKHCGESTLTPELVSPSDPSMARKRAPLPLLGTACGESGGRK
jgi:serine/threonine protein kinase